MALVEMEREGGDGGGGVGYLRDPPAWVGTVLDSSCTSSSLWMGSE